MKIQSQMYITLTGGWGVIPVISYGHKDAYISEFGEDMESNNS